MRERAFLLTTCAASWLAACGSGAPAENGAQTPANNFQAARPVQAAPQLSAQWLTGRWQVGDGGCGAGDTAFTLDPDGRYAFMEEQGRWTLEGDRLTVEVTHASADSAAQAGQRNTTIVRPLTPDEAEFVPEGQEPVRVVRCPAS